MRSFSTQHIDANAFASLALLQGYFEKADGLLEVYVFSSSSR